MSDQNKIKNIYKEWIAAAEVFSKTVVEKSQKRENMIAFANFALSTGKTLDALSTISDENNDNTIFTNNTVLMGVDIAKAAADNYTELPTENHLAFIGKLLLTPSTYFVPHFAGTMEKMFSEAINHSVIDRKTCSDLCDRTYVAYSLLPH
ncbi:MAG: hypothetical protein PHX43_09120 [Alphaproteobacteria bacterium]|nr:hypothetical protein [Alphaproteobacteria bacterium]